MHVPFPALSFWMTLKKRINCILRCPVLIKLFYHQFVAQITAVVTLQLWTATYLHSSIWLKILTGAYFFGSFLNHNFFLVIHELSHNLAFSTPAYNRWLGIFANLPIGKAGIQGVDGIEMDIPSDVETHAFAGTLTKSIWVIFQLFFYALRPLVLKSKRRNL